MLKRPENVLLEKSQMFSARIIRMTRYLRGKHVEDFMLKQVARSGTSIGANISESRSAQSSPDFISKLSIALKEADETKYWINLLFDTGSLLEDEFISIHKDLMELIYLLNAVIKTTKRNGIWISNHNL